MCDTAIGYLFATQVTSVPVNVVGGVLCITCAVISLIFWLSGGRFCPVRFFCQVLVVAGGIN